ncbi:hypothetical protein U9M48_030893 [Paspalum notatum var. saurae]|uniref:Uncharacterized protein n=1 Tax=Paspalum notatum var. saurae TaxID=547442 RepID=A0AAQ3U1X8_PASNO
MAWGAAVTSDPAVGEPVAWLRGGRCLWSGHTREVAVMAWFAASDLAPRLQRRRRWQSAYIAPVPSRCHSRRVILDSFDAFSCGRGACRLVLCLEDGLRCCNRKKRSKLAARKLKVVKDSKATK